MTTDADRERDFYRSLVELATHDSPEPLLRRALSILVEVSGAREAYVELRGTDESDTARWWAASGCDPTRLDAIRVAISTGIIAASIATGETVATSSAIDDQRFHDLTSVREHAIEAVLCVPIGRDEPLGVIYLQGRRGAAEFEPFGDAVRERVELFARTLTPTAELILHRLHDEQTELTYGGAFAGIVARSAVMRDLCARLHLVAPLDVQVLLTGPSGAGKTLLAHAIHAASKRRARPFHAVNCAAIPEALLENELFGADPGAHSAVPRGGIIGKVEAAEGGTLFLDEVAELSLASQAKLLQLLQDRSYYRLGSTRLRIADVRIIAATNASLPTAIAEKRFREDLYYRLKVFEARVPSLAERAEDIAPLAVQLCRSAAGRHNLPVASLSPAAIRALSSLEWPGNVRELMHRIETAMIDAHLRGARQIERRDILGDEAEGEHDATTLQEAMRRFQRQHVLSVLEAADWNVTEAARRLDVARSYLYTLIRAHDLRRSD